MKLKLNASIFTQTDGKYVGKLRFVVLTPVTNTLTSLIVGRSFMAQRDVIVPGSVIGTTSNQGDRIDLTFNEAELDSQPDYQENNYVSPDDDSRYDADPEPSEDPTERGGTPLTMIFTSEAAAAITPVQLAMPSTAPVTYSNKNGPDDSKWEASIQAKSPEEFLLEEDASLIRAGSKVIDKNGTVIGQVSILEFNSSGRLTALAVKEGFLFTKEVWLKAEGIDNLNQRDITLKYSGAEIKTH